MMRVVPAALEPSALEKALNFKEEQISELPENAHQRLKNLVADLRLGLSGYQLTYDQGQRKIRQIQGQQPEEFACTKAYQQLESSLQGHKKSTEDKSLFDAHLKASLEDQFNFLQKNGLPQAKNAAEFHQLKAQDQLLLSKADKPAEYTPTPISKPKKAILSLNKITVGFITAFSLNHLFNPNNYELVTVILVIIGAGASVAMLVLIEAAIHMAKFSNKKAKYYAAAAIITITYMIAEAWLNYEGIISISREMAVQNAMDGMLLEEGGEAPEIEAPHHFSVLFFTLALVGFSAAYAAFSGHCRAILDIQKRELDIAVARLRLNGVMMEKAATVDRPNFIESMRKEVRRKPMQNPITKWHTAAVNSQARAETQLEQNAAKIARDLEAIAMKLQTGIKQLGHEIEKESKAGRKKPWVIPLFKAQ